MPKVRFAPSPTGYLHIGGARTALFNWMYARSTDSVFVLRIEDTDLERSKKEFEQEILDSMTWLGLTWDELYRQSERFDLYHEQAQRLIDEGKAYRHGQAVLLKMTEKQLKIYDLIRGEVDFDTANFILRDENMKPVLDEHGQTQLRDEVLIKSDGSPAYSFCCAIDDALMEITHVIRGEDHISNTPRQLMIYDALGFKPPKFAHLPLIMGQDGGRLSKRDGAVAVLDYRRQGFVPEALVNYLMLLGWSPGNDEIITLQAAVKKFSMKKVNKAAAAFSMEKLKWLNAQYLRQMDTETLVELLQPILDQKGFQVPDSSGKWLKNVVDLFKGRLFTLHDFVTWADYLFVDQLVIDPELKAEHGAASKTIIFEPLANALENLDEFSAGQIETTFREVVELQQGKVKDFIQPVRVAVTGRPVGPSLFECLALLDQKKVAMRLREALKN